LGHGDGAISWRGSERPALQTIDRYFPMITYQVRGLGTVRTRRDAIIIGGGIVGTAVAYFLAKRGMKPLIIERDQPGCLQSGRNMGSVRQQGRDLRELPLMMEGMKIWDGLEGELNRSLGWRRSGNLILARNDDQTAMFERWCSYVRSYGLESEIISAGHISRLTGDMKHAGRVGLYTASDGKADPSRVTRAFFDAAIEMGAEFLTGQGVDEILVQGGRACGVRVGAGEYRSDTIICAAGTASQGLLRRHSIRIPMETVRASIVRIVCRNVNFEPVLTAPGFSGRQSVDGSIHLGATSSIDYDVGLKSWDGIRWFKDKYSSHARAIKINLPGLAGLRSRKGVPAVDIPQARSFVPVNLKSIGLAIQKFRKYYPQAEEIELVSCWAGNPDFTPDELPVIGLSSKVDNLLIGFGGHGFGFGPMVATILADLATGRRSAAIHDFHPDRFANGTWSKPDFQLVI
jgi:glycine/D-amino acid oxidase-like deaminating enzyme